MSKDSKTKDTGKENLPAQAGENLPVEYEGGETQTLNVIGREYPWISVDQKNGTFVNSLTDEQFGKFRGLILATYPSRARP